MKDGSSVLILSFVQRFLWWNLADFMSELQVTNKVFLLVFLYERKPTPHEKSKFVLITDNAKQGGNGEV